MENKSPATPNDYLAKNIFQKKKSLIFLSLFTLLILIGLCAFFIGQNKIEKNTKISDNKLSKNTPPILPFEKSDFLSLEGKLIYAKNIGSQFNYIEKDLKSSDESILAYWSGDQTYRISHDGKSVAYFDPEWGLVIEDTSSHKKELILENSKVFNSPEQNSYYHPLEWSPDDRKILVDTHHWESSSLGILDVTTKRFSGIKNYDGTRSGCLNGTWSGSVNVLLWGYNYGHPCNVMPGLHLLNINTMTTKPLFGTIKNEKEFSVSDATLSPDSKNVYFNASAGIEKSPEDGFYSIPIQGGEAKKIQVENLGNYWINGSSYFINSENGIELYDLNSKSKKTLVKITDPKLSASVLAVSPDKKYLAYVLSVKKHDANGNPIYENTSEENVLKIISLNDLKVYDIDKNINTSSPIRWLP